MGKMIKRKDLSHSDLGELEWLDDWERGIHTSQLRRLTESAINIFIAQHTFKGLVEFMPKQV